MAAGIFAVLADEIGPGLSGHWQRTIIGAVTPVAIQSIGPAAVAGRTHEDRVDTRAAMSD